MEEANPLGVALIISCIVGTIIKFLQWVNVL